MTETRTAKKATYSLPNESRKRSSWQLEKSIFLMSCFKMKIKRELFICLFILRGYNVTPFTLALNGASKYPKVYSGLDSMLTKNALNTSDITNVKLNYS